MKRHFQFRHLLLTQCWLWDIFCFYQKRHCPLWNFLFSDTFSWDIVGCETFSVFIKKDIVRYEIFCFQTFSVVRHVQLSDTCSCPKRAVVRNLQLSDTLHYETLSVTQGWREVWKFEWASSVVHRHCSAAPFILPKSEGVYPPLHPFGFYNTSDHLLLSTFS